VFTRKPFAFKQLNEIELEQSIATGLGSSTTDDDFGADVNSGSGTVCVFR
jgi:hypothetical protein